MTAALELHCPPRYGTPRSPDRPTLGGNVARIAAALGRPLLPHQRLIADVALEIDPKTGMLAYDEANIVINRQQGKTELAFPLMTHRCVGFDRALTQWVRRELGHDVPDPGPQRVLYTAQTADAARQKWRDIHVTRLERSGFRSQVSIRKRLNAEAIFWPNGSSWAPASTTGKTGGTGDTIDQAFIDEAWSRPDNRTELGMRPAMLTRPWRQLWVMSMIPGLSRALPGTWPYLFQKRQNGRARVQANQRRGVAYFEWSADPSDDPGDPATWWSCMPALGHTVSESAIGSDFEAMDLVDFMAEYLGIAPESGLAQWRVISEETWRALRVPRSRDMWMDPCALGIDAQPDQSYGSLGMAALTPMGDTFVELIERKPGTAWLVDAVRIVAEKFLPTAIGIAAHGPCAHLIEPIRRMKADRNLDFEVIELQGPAVSQACRQLYLETGEIGEPAGDERPRRVVHIDQDELNASVGSAQKYVFSDEWRWQRQLVGADAGPLYAVTLARAAGEALEWLGGSYNIADSLGGARP